MISTLKLWRYESMVLCVLVSALFVKIAQAQKSQMSNDPQMRDLPGDEEYEDDEEEDDNETEDYDGSEDYDDGLEMDERQNVVNKVGQMTTHKDTTLKPTGSKPSPEQAVPRKPLDQKDGTTTKKDSYIFRHISKPTSPPPILQQPVKKPVGGNISPAEGNILDLSGKDCPCPNKRDRCILNGDCKSEYTTCYISEKTKTTKETCPDNKVFKNDWVDCVSMNECQGKYY